MDNIKLSNHAQERMKKRKISLKAVQNAFNKGGDVYCNDNTNEYFCIKGELHIPFKMKENQIIIVTVYKSSHPNHLKRNKYNLLRKI